MKPSQDFSELKHLKSRHTPVMEPCIPLDYEKSIVHELRIDDLIPGSLWRHFNGKIYSIVTPAKGHDYGEDIIVYQDIHTYVCYVRLWKDFIKLTSHGKSRYEKFLGSPKEAIAAYVK